MSMDGRFIHYLSVELDETLGSGRIQKIYQLSKTDFLFVVRAPGKTHQLYLSLSTSVTRIHVTLHLYDKPENPSGFCMLLRKYLEGGIIKKIESIEGDRIIRVKVLNHNEIGDETEYVFYMEIMGRYANLIVTSSDNKIIDAFKHISPFEDSSRTIERGATYIIPLDNKINPLDTGKVKEFFGSNPDVNGKMIVNNFRGLSPLFAQYFIDQLPGHNLSANVLFESLLATPINPTLYVGLNKKAFYYFDVFKSGEKMYFSSLSALLDEYFLDAGRQERNRQISKNLIQFIKRELDRNTNKLEKLSDDMANAKNCDVFRIKGDVILQNQNLIAKGQIKLESLSYELKQNVIIDLDPLLTPIKNANQYFRKYKKFKSSVQYINEQIVATKKQIDYFQLLGIQIESASQIDLDEIQQELSSLGYLRKKSIRQKHKVPNYDTYVDAENKEIVVGKNNMQNEYITHHLAKPNEWWFHTQGHHGSHVVVRATDNLTENSIRTAANLAAIHSAAKHSSSVPVDYTRVKYVKKIPGETGAFVSYSNQKTIYIDPDINLIDKLIKKKK